MPSPTEISLIGDLIERGPKSWLMNKRFQEKILVTKELQEAGWVSSLMVPFERPIRVAVKPLGGLPGFDRSGSGSGVMDLYNHS